MRPEIDDAGREEHPRYAVWALLVAPLTVHLCGDSGPIAAGVVLWLGMAFAVLVLLFVPRPVGPPAGPQRRAGDRA